MAYIVQVHDCLTCMTKYFGEYDQILFNIVNLSVYNSVKLSFTLI